MGASAGNGVRATGHGTRDTGHGTRDTGHGRLLVVDLNAVSRSWALTPDGERRIREAAPADWRVQVVQSPTSSDGDGPSRPSDEVMAAIVDAEVYFGFGIPRILFLEGK